MANLGSTLYLLQRNNMAAIRSQAARRERRLIDTSAAAKIPIEIAAKPGHWPLFGARAKMTSRAAEPACSTGIER
jgi:hypothetical protein